jgi:hypothetical protein
MTIFAVITPPDNQKLAALEAAVNEKFSGRVYKIATGQFAVSADNITTQQVGERLGVGTGDLGFVLILPISNYYGWHSRNLWEWLAAESKRSPT